MKKYFWKKIYNKGQIVNKKYTKKKLKHLKN